MLIDFRQLFPKYNIKPKGVLHIGANVGEEAPVYDELGVKNVQWIEGNPEIFPKLIDNIRPYPNQFAMLALVGDKHDEPVNFHVSNNGSQSSSVLELGTHLQQHPEVHYTHDIALTMKRLDVLLGGKLAFEMDFLNIDLQGAELMALRGLGDLLRNFKWAYLEVNKAEVYKGCAQVEEVDSFMAGFGFLRVETKWVGNWGDACFLHRDVAGPYKHMG